MRPMIKLTEVFEVEQLQQIQDYYSDATGLAAIIVDYKGNPITSYSNFTPYCMKVRENPDWLEACHRSDAHGGIQAANTGKPSIYICHGGLVDLAVPIMFKGSYLGAVLSGQVRIPDEELARLPVDCAMTLTDFSNHPEVTKLREDTQLTTIKQVLASANLLKMIVDHLLEKPMIENMERELTEKNQTLMEEMQQRNKIESALKEADLKALQAQVNPHFLFNTLNTIGRLAMMEQADRTQEMIYLFSDMMRYSLKKEKSDFVTVGEELEHVKNYLSIQKMRLGNRLEYRINNDSECNRILCPFMTIQPFVENAIIYAVEPRKEGGKIYIEAIKKDNALHIQIKDDGPGIPMDIQKALLNGTYETKEDDRGNGIGIDNCNQRIKYYYGDDHGIQFDNTDPVGANVKIILPIQVKTGRKY